MSSLARYENSFCATILYDSIMIKNGGSVSSVLLERNVRATRSAPLESFNENSVNEDYVIYARHKMLMKNCSAQKVEPELSR